MGEAGQSMAACILESIRGTELEVHVVLLEQEFTIDQLISLSPGSILLFEAQTHTQTQLAEGQAAVTEVGQAGLKIGHKKVAKGQVVQMGESYGVRITSVA